MSTLQARRSRCARHLLAIGAGEKPTNEFRLLSYINEKRIVAIIRLQLAEGDVPIPAS